MTRVTKPKVKKTIRHNPEAPRPAQAAQIAFVLIGVAKGKTWADVVADTTLSERVELTEEQQKLLEEFAWILPYLGKGGGDFSARTIICCQECERVMFTSGSAAAPKNCKLNLSCKGVPVRAKSIQERVAVE